LWHGTCPLIEKLSVRKGCGRLLKLIVAKTSVEKPSSNYANEGNCQNHQGEDGVEKALSTKKGGKRGPA